MGELPEMRIFCAALLAAVLAQDDLDSFARGKKKKNKTKVPTTTTTTTTTTATTTSTTVTDQPDKNYQDPVLNEIFNKKEREEQQYESTTAISDAGQQEYNPPQQQQQINYDGNLNLNEIEIKMMLQPDFKKFCWNCNVGGNNDPDLLRAKCMAEGKYEACSSGNSDCYVTMRKNEGRINMLQSGCKQLSACSAESRQVMGGACKPGAEKGPSHCNYCCDYENCNLEFLEANNYDPTLAAFELSA